MIEMRNLPIPGAIAGDFIRYRIYDELLPDGSVVAMSGFFDASVVGLVANRGYVMWLVKEEPSGQVVLRLLPHNRVNGSDDYDCSIMQVPTEDVKKRIGWWRTDTEGHLSLMNYDGRRCHYHQSAEMALGFIPNDKWHALKIVPGPLNPPVAGTHLYFPPDMAVNTIWRPEVFAKDDYADRDVVAATRNGSPTTLNFALAQVTFGLVSEDGSPKHFRTCKAYTAQDGRLHADDHLAVPHRRWDKHIRLRGPLSTKVNIIFTGFDFGEREDVPDRPVITHSGVLTGAADPNNLVDWLHGENTQESTYFATFGPSIAGQWIQAEYPTPRVLKYAWWYQDPSGGKTLGTWKYQGGDGTNWTDLSSSFVLGGSEFQAHDLQSNTTAYTHYRLLGVSGSATGNPWLREWALMAA